MPLKAAISSSGKHRATLGLPRWLEWLGWLATALMALAVVARDRFDGLGGGGSRPL
jgi:hypothetical protein